MSSRCTTIPLFLTCLIPAIPTLFSFVFHTPIISYLRSQFVLYRSFFLSHSPNILTSHLFAPYFLPFLFYCSSQNKVLQSYPECFHYHQSSMLLIPSYPARKFNVIWTVNMDVIIYWYGQLSKSRFLYKCSFSHIWLHAKAVFTCTYLYYFDRSYLTFIVITFLFQFFEVSNNSRLLVLTV